MGEGRRPGVSTSPLGGVGARATGGRNGRRTWQTHVTSRRMDRLRKWVTESALRRYFAPTFFIFRSIFRFSSQRSGISGKNILVSAKKKKQIDAKCSETSKSVLRMLIGRLVRRQSPKYLVKLVGE